MNTPSTPPPKEAQMSAEKQWIEWNGGECPVPLDAVVQVKFRNGTKHTEQANWWAGGMGVNNWKHGAAYPLADIVAYRIVAASQ